MATQLVSFVSVAEHYKAGESIGEPAKNHESSQEKTEETSRCQIPSFKIVARKARSRPASDSGTVIYGEKSGVGKTELHEQQKGNPDEKSHVRNVRHLEREEKRKNDLDKSRHPF